MEHASTTTHHQPTHTASTETDDHTHTTAIITPDIIRYSHVSLIGVHGVYQTRRLTDEYSAISRQSPSPAACSSVPLYLFLISSVAVVSSCCSIMLRTTVIKRLSRCHKQRRSQRPQRNAELSHGVLLADSIYRSPIDTSD